jgi:hypothetical protein
MLAFGAGLALERRLVFAQAGVVFGRIVNDHLTDRHGAML